MATLKLRVLFLDGKSELPLMTMYLSKVYGGTAKAKRKD